MPAGGEPGQVLLFDGTEAVFGSIPYVHEWQALTAGNSAGANRWFQAAGSATAMGTTEGVSHRELQLSGTMRKLRISMFAVLASQMTVTWLLNTIAQQSLVIPAGQINGEVAFSVPVLAGDIVSMRSVTVGAEAGNAHLRAYLLQDVP